MEVSTSLAALINHCARLMEAGEELGLAETEKTIIDEKIVELLQTRFGSKMDLTIFSTQMNHGDLWKEVDAHLRRYLISDVNPHQPGTSARRWGISRNGLALVISLSAELLVSGELKS